MRDGGATPRGPAFRRASDTGAAASAAASSTARAFGRLSVTAGRHRGADVALSKSALTIGSALGADVVLTDDGIAARHCNLRFERQRGKPVIMVTPLADAVTANGRELPPDIEAAIPLPATLRLGTAEIVIAPPPRARLDRRLLATIPAAIVAGGIGGYVLSSLGSMLTSGSTPTPMLRLPDAPRVNAAAPVSDVLFRDLSTRLATAGLTSQVTLERRGGIVVVDGTLDGQTYTKWRTVKQAFLANGGDARVLADMVKTSTAAVAPQGLIASIVYANPPYVVGASGRKARVGEALDDGWIIDQIGEDSVQIRRGRAIVTIGAGNGGRP